MSAPRKPDPDTRPRQGPPPTPDRLATLSREIAAGTYRVDPRTIAEAMLKSRDRPERRD